MNTLSVRLRYRPIRIGWCLQRDDFEAFRQSARRSFSLWGGRFNPIIPVDDPAHARRLIDLFRVDCLFAASDTAAVKAFIEQQKHLPWMDYHDGLTIENGPGDKTSALADLLTPIGRLFENHFKNNPTAEPLITLYDWQNDDPLRDLFLTTFGELPPVEETAEDYRALMQLHLKAERHVIDTALPATLPQLGRMTLSAFSRIDCRQHYAVQNHWWMPGFYLGSVTNFTDLTNYWNLRATDIPLIFFDPDHAERLSLIRQQWLADLPQLLNPKRRQKGAAIWHSEDREAGDLTPFGENLTVCPIGDLSWNGLNIRAPFMHFGEGEALASIDNAAEPPSISFVIPDSPLKETQAFNGQEYIVSVDPGIGLFADERYTLHFPFVPALNEFYGRSAVSQWNKARAEPESLGVITDGHTSHLSVRAVEATQLIEEIFATVGIKAKPSAAGLVCNRLVLQMGGIDGCRVFKIGGVRDLIEKYSPDQSFTTSAAKQIIRANDTDHPLSNYKYLYIEQRAVGSDLTNDAVLAHLLRKEVFRPGLKLACPNCRLEYWRALDDVKTKNECEYCGHLSNIGPQLRDRDWAFRRSGLFGRNDHQEGAIPVVLTLQQLSRMHSMSPRIQSTAMMLEANGADIAKCETDFVVLSTRNRDHRIQIAIGECKTRQPITEKDVQNLLRVAKAFPTDRYDVFIVFAKLDEFSEEEIEFIKQVNTDHAQRAIMLTARELEPWQIYERTEKEFDIRRIAVGFDDLARTTEIVFFEKRRKGQVEVAEMPPHV